MRSSLLALCAFLLQTTSFSQGVITFYNDGLWTQDGSTYRAGIFRERPFNPGDPTGGSPIGAGEGYTAGLFVATNSATPLATTTFRTTNGTEVFATAQDVTIPGYWPGQSAYLIIRVWPTEFGSWQNAQLQWGVQEVVFGTRALGGPNLDPNFPPIPPPDLGPSFIGFEMSTPPGPRPPFPISEAPAAIAQPASFAQVAAAEQNGLTLNVTLRPGTNLVSNPLLATDNSIGALFKNIQGGVPSGTKIFKLVNGRFITALWSILDNKFIPDAVASQTVLPGEGVLLLLPGHVEKILTFNGQPQQGEACTSIPPGFSLKANMSPLDLNLGKTDFTVAGGERIYTLNRATARYEMSQYDDLGEVWEPAIPTIPFGEAFYWFNPMPWSRSWCQHAIGVLRQRVDEIDLSWTLPAFALESSTDLINWTEVLPSGNTNTTIHISPANAFFRLRRQ